MLIVFTGNGKGKTSAALGTALRSSGWGKKVCIIQFIKGNKEIGEWKALQKISNFQFPISNDDAVLCFTKTKNDKPPQINILQFFDDNKLSITEKEITDLKSEEYKKSCQKAWDFAKKSILTKQYDLMVLDEVNNALHYGLLDKKEFLNFIRDNLVSIRENSRPDIVFTGRNAPPELIEIADLVTEMKEIKHPFKKGIKAKEGIDY